MSDAFTTLTDRLRFPEGPIALSDGSCLVVEIEGRALTRVLPNGDLTVIAELEGGPNGAALGPDGWCYICNSGGWIYTAHENGQRPIAQAERNGWIERVHLRTGAVERLYTHAGSVPLRSPNDLVFDRHGGFYFSDLGKRGDRRIDWSSVYYAKADGSFITEVVHPIITPNGVGLSPDHSTLYAAETLTGRLWAFTLEAPGRIRPEPWPSPNGGRLVAGVPGYSLFNSLAVQADGAVCVATLFNGGITVIEPRGGAFAHRPMPDIYTTNICFGGADLRTAFITLSLSGRLVSMPWPAAGLKLEHSDFQFEGDTA